MFVGGVCALDVGNRVVGTEAGQRVNVAVGVVACEVAVVEPEDASCVERLEQPGLDLFLCQRLVAVGCKQASACGQDGALSVALDAAAFQHEVEVVLIVPSRDALFRHAPADAVVLPCGELLAPAVEAEVEQMRSVGCKQGDEAVVASPGVVGGCLAEGGSLQAFGREMTLEECAYMFGLGRYNNKMYARGDFPCHVDVAACHFGQYGLPIGSGMRPGQLHGTLLVPFCRQYMVRSL